MFCVASPFCSSHTYPNTLAYVAMNFLNRKEEDLFDKLLSFIKSINGKSFLVLFCFYHPEKKTCLLRKVYLILCQHLLYFLIVSLERFIFLGAYIQVYLLSGKVLAADGGELKENCWSGHFIHPPSICEKFQLQLYMLE